MKSIKISAFVFLAFALSAQAQQPTWNDAQMEVWKVVEQSWVDDTKETGKWPKDYTHDKYVTWSADDAGPVYKDSSIKWSRFGDESNETLIYEISPAAITVEATTAVVNYYATTVTKDAKGERKQAIVRISEVLIKDGKKWMFLAGSSFEPKMN